MLINKQNLNDLFTQAKVTFHKAFDAAPSVWQEIAMEVPSTSGQNDYKWLSNFPKMRRWIGEKFIKSLAAFKYVVVNDDFEATVEVDRNDIEDDNIGFIGPQTQGAAFSSKQWPDEMVFEAVNRGTTAACFDGQYFFDTDHPVGDGVVSNKYSLALDISTVTQAKATFGAVRAGMMGIKDDEGRPLNVTPNKVLCGPALAADFRILATSEKLDDGKPNPYRGTFTVVEDARIESATAWYLLDMTKPVKPFIFQPRKKPVFVSQTDLNSDNVFMRKKYRFGAEARGAAGYGFWQLAAQGNQ